MLLDDRRHRCQIGQQHGQMSARNQLELRFLRHSLPAIHREARGIHSRQHHQHRAAIPASDKPRMPRHRLCAAAATLSPRYSVKIHTAERLIAKRLNVSLPLHRWRRRKNGQQLYCFTLLEQLLGDGPGHQRAIAVSGQTIRTARLLRANVAQSIRRHFFDGVRHEIAAGPVGMNSNQPDVVQVSGQRNTKQPRAVKLAVRKNSGRPLPFRISTRGRSKEDSSFRSKYCANC